MFSITVLNLPRSPIKLMGLSHFIIVLQSCANKKTIRLTSPVFNQGWIPNFCLFLEIATR
mgnify:FL=1